MSDFLFIYGTLLPGEAVADVANIVQQLHRLGPAYVHGRLYDLGEYPGAILDAAAETKIEGEVFELSTDPSVLSALDSYEGYDLADPTNSLFIRIKSPVRLLDGREIESWMYVYNRDPGKALLIRDGNYRKSKAA
ncbi:MAG: gamma-glutamylcyclotransferase [Pyrinomonadaceae bacterium]